MFRYSLVSYRTNGKSVRRRSETTHLLPDKTAYGPKRPKGNLPNFKKGLIGRETL